MSDLKKIVIHDVFWRSLKRFWTLLIGLIISIILVRLLGPEEYGTVALLSIFIAICGVFVDSGFRTALIQKRKLILLILIHYHPIRAK
jgi:O-antigen/teichoic acid export membrane protein